MHEFPKCLFHQLYPQFASVANYVGSILQNRIKLHQLTDFRILIVVYLARAFNWRIRTATLWIDEREVDPITERVANACGIDTKIIQNAFAFCPNFKLIIQPERVTADTLNRSYIVLYPNDNPYGIWQPADKCHPHDEPLSLPNPHLCDFYLHHETDDSCDCKRHCSIT